MLTTAQLFAVVAENFDQEGAGKAPTSQSQSDGDRLHRDLASRTAAKLTRDETSTALAARAVSARQSRLCPADPADGRLGLLGLVGTRTLVPFVLQASRLECAEPRTTQASRGFKVGTCERFDTLSERRLST